MRRSQLYDLIAAADKAPDPIDLTKEEQELSEANLHRLINYVARGGDTVAVNLTSPVFGQALHN